MSRLPMKLQIFAEPGSTDPEAQATPPAGQPQTRSIMIRLRSLSRENSLWQKKVC